MNPQTSGQASDSNPDEFNRTCLWDQDSVVHLQGFAGMRDCFRVSRILRQHERASDPGLGKEVGQVFLPLTKQTRGKTFINAYKYMNAKFDDDEVIPGRAEHNSRVFYFKKTAISARVLFEN